MKASVIVRDDKPAVFPANGRVGHLLASVKENEGPEDSSLVED